MVNHVCYPTLELRITRILPMTQLCKALFIVSGLALASCSNTDRLDVGTSSEDQEGAFGLGESETIGDPLALSAEEAEFVDLVGDRVLFAVDESTLNSEARQLLSGQAEWLARNLGFTVLIEGHADERGTQEYNLALGARRASAVQQFLIAQGISPGRLDIVTYGKERPIEICSEESCYSRNRRAVTVLLSGTG